MQIQTFFIKIFDHDLLQAWQVKIALIYKNKNP